MKFPDFKNKRILVPVIVVSTAIVLIADLLTPVGFMTWVFYYFPFYLICINYSEKASYSSIIIYILLFTIGLVLRPSGIPFQYAVVNGIAGIILGVLIAFLINLQKRKQQEISEMKERYDMAVTASKAGIWDFSLTGNKIIWNDNMFKLYGIPNDEFDGTPESWMKLIAPEDIERASINIKKALLEQSEFEETFCIVRNDGQRRYIRNFGRISRDQAGNPVRIAGINIDVTEQKFNEIRLQELNSKLSQSNHELENFAYIASHDLQEPLRMISSFSTILEKRYSGKLDQEAHEFINFIVDGTRQMQALITDLLTYSRVTTQPGEHHQTDTGKIIRKALDNLHKKIEDTSAKITVEEMPLIFGDESQLIRLFQNLIDNAMKFSVDRTPEISINCKPGLNDWLFSVSDNGLGIEKKFSEKIFLIFQRLHPRDKYPGTGIGLAICKKIVELHKGKIWFESEPGKGTTFYFTIQKNLSDEPC